MKWKVTAALVLLFSLTGGTLLYADGPSVQRIKVLFNNKEITDGAYVIDGKTYVPVRALDGVVSYSSAGVVSFNKPNVHIFLFKGDTPFGNVNVGKLKFDVFCQIDSLTTSIDSVKVAIQAPDGSIKSIQSQNIGSDQKDNFWFRTSDFTYDFKTAGKYSVGFYVKVSGSDDYTLVSEKIVTAIP